MASQSICATLFKTSWHLSAALFRHCVLHWQVALGRINISLVVPCGMLRASLYCLVQETIKGLRNIPRHTYEDSHRSQWSHRTSSKSFKVQTGEILSSNRPPFWSLFRKIIVVGFCFRVQSSRHWHMPPSTTARTFNTCPETWKAVRLDLLIYRLGANMP